MSSEKTISSSNISRISFIFFSPAASAEEEIDVTIPVIFRLFTGTITQDPGAILSTKGEGIRYVNSPEEIAGKERVTEAKVEEEDFSEFNI